MVLSLPVVTFLVVNLLVASASLSRARGHLTGITFYDKHRHLGLRP